MHLSKSGMKKAKKEAVIAKSNGEEKLSYLILIFYASFMHHLIVFMHHL